MDMAQSRSLRVWIAGGLGTAFVVASAAAVAQIKPPPMPANQRGVYLVKQDFSDCQNNNVPNTDGPNVGGFVKVIRGTDGNTTVAIALTGTPNTSYHFFLKCIRILGDVITGDEGAGIAEFSFKTSEVGNTYAFDSYPEGAPAGNKFQSGTVKY
jgi:hypothetical protein